MGSRWSGAMVVAAAALALPACWPGSQTCSVAHAVFGGGGLNQVGQPGQPLPEPIAVLVRDDCGFPAEGVTVNWSVEAGHGTLASSQSRTNGSGLARNTWTLPDAPGVYRAVGSFEGKVVPFDARAAGSEACLNRELWDEFFSDRDWDRVIEAPPAFQNTVELRNAGGNPGGYRRMTHVLDGPGTMVVHHLHPQAYEPRLDLPVRSFTYVEDRIQFDPPFPGAAVGGGVVVAQAGRVHRVPLTGGSFRHTDWARAEVTLTPADFPGVDWSRNGSPIRFGYYRSNSNTTANRATVTHGIDNWRVAVCR